MPLSYDAIQLHVQANITSLHESAYKDGVLMMPRLSDMSDVFYWISVFSCAPIRNSDRNVTVYWMLHKGKEELIIKLKEHQREIPSRYTHPVRIFPV